MSVHRETPGKRYVKVRADHGFDGHIRPLRFRAEDGPAYRIDRVLDEREAPALKAGGQGIRYTCQVGERIVMLFYDAPYWFIEQEAPEGHCGSARNAQA